MSEKKKARGKARKKPRTQREEMNASDERRRIRRKNRRSPALFATDSIGQRDRPRLGYRKNGIPISIFPEFSFVPGQFKDLSVLILDQR
jgi:hypothetical protein